MSTPAGWFWDRGGYTPQPATHKRSEHTTHTPREISPLLHILQIVHPHTAQKTKASQNNYICTFAPTLCNLQRTLLFCSKITTI